MQKKGVHTSEPEACITAEILGIHALVFQNAVAAIVLAMMFSIAQDASMYVLHVSP